MNKRTVLFFLQVIDMKQDKEWSAGVGLLIGLAAAVTGVVLYVRSGRKLSRDLRSLKDWAEDTSLDAKRLVRRTTNRVHDVAEDSRESLEELADTATHAMAKVRGEALKMRP